MDILGGTAWSYAAIPCIYAFMMLIRTGCMALFNLTFFRWIKERERPALGGGAWGRRLRLGRWLEEAAGGQGGAAGPQPGPWLRGSPGRQPRPAAPCPHPHPCPCFPPAALTWAEVLFSGWAGLRGAISLILNADFIAHRWGGWCCWAEGRRAGLRVCTAQPPAANQPPACSCPRFSPPPRSAFLQGDPNNPNDPNRQIGAPPAPEGLRCPQRSTRRLPCRRPPTSRFFLFRPACRPGQLRHRHLDVRLCAADADRQRAHHRVRGRLLAAACSARTWLLAARGMAPASIRSPCRPEFPLCAAT